MLPAVEEEAVLRIKNQKDFWAGVLFMAVGVFFAGLGSQYALGTATRIGPGYFPTGLGMVVILIGIIVAAGSLSAKAPAERVEKFAIFTVVLILGSITAFGLLLKPLGLILSLLVLIAVSSYASHEFSWKAMLMNAGVLIGTCLAIFVWALKLELALWPFFIGR